ncbi:hypothetical protein BB560_005300, partial [Smittium megazygosporum]
MPCNLKGKKQILLLVMGPDDWEQISTKDLDSSDSESSSPEVPVLPLRNTPSTKDITTGRPTKIKRFRSSSKHSISNTIPPSVYSIFDNVIRSTSSNVEQLVTISKRKIKFAFDTSKSDLLPSELPQNTKNTHSSPFNKYSSSRSKSTVDYPSYSATIISHKKLSVDSPSTTSFNNSPTVTCDSDRFNKVSKFDTILRPLAPISDNPSPSHKK